ncbi:MAG: hypothetical protein KKA28_14600 [Planctomycetes bacterium]|nr:hypothetical protein [Planctomycetota bacterium]MCG2685662.1 hypothetical protein [Planctomycetales bacterium]
MIDVSTLVLLCKNALAALKWTKEHYESTRFSEEEKAILVAAADQGAIQIVLSDSLLSVFGGGILFTAPADPTYRARHLDAFAQLCDRGLITHHEGEMFCLNGKGFELARKVKAIEQDSGSQS